MSQEHRVEVIRIGKVEKHPNADSLSLTYVHGGYPVIFKDGSYKEGDLAVYIPVESIVPTDNPRFDFLGSKNVIRAKRLRDIFSMGLLTPNDGWSEGQEVSKELGITQWMPPEPITTSGEQIKDPGFIPVGTDVEGYRKYSYILDPEEEVVVLEKIEGCNGRFCYSRDQFWLGSRTQFKKNEPGHVWHTAAKTEHLEEKLKQAEDIVFYGEVYGQVSGFKYDIKTVSAGFMVFDTMDIKTYSYNNWDETVALAEKLGLKTTPVIFRGKAKDIKREWAEGKSLVPGSSNIKEGFVVKPTKERRDLNLGRVIMKLKGEDYLLRKK